MKFNLVQKIAFAVSTLVLLYVLADAFMQKSIQLEKTKSVKGVFDAIVRIHPSGKISVSYNLYLEDDPAIYKVMPDYSNCFDAESFTRNVHQGDSLTLNINPNKTLRSDEYTGVVAIIANDKNYLNLNCINSQLNFEKYLILLLFIFYLGFYIYMFRKSKNRRA